MTFRWPPRPARGGWTDADRGSATIWVLGCCALLLVVGCTALLRTEAVLARHRAESAADLAALAGAGQIGVGDRICAAAGASAAANAAHLVGCGPAVSAAGRSGTVVVRVQVTVRLPMLGSRSVVATARAGRLPAVGEAYGPAP